MKVQPPGTRQCSSTVTVCSTGRYSAMAGRTRRFGPGSCGLSGGCILTPLFKAAGYTVVVVTNQPDVARGLQRAEVVHQINRELFRVEVTAVYVCFHDDADGCLCRKPAPGLLLDAAHDLGIDLSRSFMVGDRWRDVEAGRRAGCRTVHIDRQYSERSPEYADLVTTSLADAVSWIESTNYRRGPRYGQSQGEWFANKGLCRRG